MSFAAGMHHQHTNQTAPPGAARLQDITLVFTDIEESTAAVERHGDDEWSEILAAHHRIVRQRTVEFGGTRSSSLGDGFLLTFPALEPALRCAQAIQRDLRAHAAAHPGRGIRVRVGIHTGETIVANDDSLVGRDVHLAARVADRAAGDEILVTARALERGTVPSTLSILDAGTVELRGLAGVHELHRAEWT